MAASNSHNVTVVDERQAALWCPYRPVQYLGSKLRVMGEIAEAASLVAGKGAPAADLFTGTTVVAQQLALNGAPVTAVDSQQYARTFAVALLGVGRAPIETVSGEKILDFATQLTTTTSEDWVEEARRSESAALKRGDAVELRNIYKLLPVERAGGSASDRPHSITTVYSGTYFGVGQAADIDLLHRTIQRSRLEGRLSDWQAAAALTALMRAASLAVHSAGKHFAQPLKGRADNRLFLDQRLLSDRAISIGETFIEGCRQISATPFTRSHGHSAQCSDAVQFALGGSSDHRLYYLDPPYTAQQYSRFYHVLETIAGDGAPRLPKDSPLSEGLYPEGRYKSTFSSKVGARGAMRALVSEIARRGASAIISYSVSSATSNGNARMVTLEDLLEICADAFGTSRVECSRMVHRYRQFNSALNANSERDDAEILILCKSA